MQTRKWKHRAPQKAFSRQERKDQIIGQFSIWHGNNDTDPKTMYRIARALGMSPDQKITDMLLELVGEGKLKFDVREKSGRWTARDYSLAHAPDLITRNVKRRIIVKHKGVERGQLELAL